MNIEKAIEQENSLLEGKRRAPHVKTFFHEPTFTATSVVSDDATRRAVIIDSVWDFDQPSGRTSFEAADEIVAYVQEQRAEERRVGKECGRTCRSRWSPYN